MNHPHVRLILSVAVGISLLWSSPALAETISSISVDEPPPDSIEARGGESNRPTAQEQAPASVEPPIQVARLLAAMVEYRTAWRQGYGFLIGDGRTVVAPGLNGGSRRITVRSVDGSGEPVRVARVVAHREEAEMAERSSTFEPLVVLELEVPLSGRPLAVSPSAPELGELVWFVTNRGDPDDRPTEQTLEIGSTTVTSSAPTSVGVGIPSRQRWEGTPLFDSTGAIVAFQGWGGRAPRPARVLAAFSADGGSTADDSSEPSGHDAANVGTDEDEQSTFAEHRRIMQPLFGFRFGTEFGGFESNPFTLDVELGFTLWDQLGIALRLGTTVDSSFLQTLSSPGGNLGEGRVSMSSSTLSLALEARYRLMILNGRVPISVDFVGGVQYAANFRESDDLAFYATEPACDPIGGGCGVTLGEAPADDVSHYVGATLGLDVRLGLLVVGYRFTPSVLSNGLPNTHRLSFGIAF